MGKEVEKKVGKKDGKKVEKKVWGKVGKIVGGKKSGKSSRKTSRKEKSNTKFAWHFSTGLRSIQDKKFFIFLSSRIDKLCRDLVSPLGKNVTLLLIQKVTLRARKDSGYRK